MGMKYIIYEITPLNKSVLYSYVGSTKNFRTRKCNHKNNCYNENDTKKFNFPLYQFILANGGWEAFEMNPIEEIEVENRTQARIREQFFKNDRETKFQVLNVYNPYTNRTEYYKNYCEENSEKIKKREKHYRDENSEKIKEREKKYRDENSGKKKEYLKNYREENSEKINEYQKHYRDENKQQINEKANENYICPCGGKFTTTNKIQHYKTLKHLAYVQACLTLTTL